MKDKLKEILELYDHTLDTYNKEIRAAFKPSDFLQYNEILFSAHSCAIEGNSFTVNDTKELKEKGISLKLYNRSLLEAYEILDHFKAYEFLMDNLDKPLTEDLLLETHKILTFNTIKFTKGYDPGTYTDTQMVAGDTIFTDYKIGIPKVPELLEETQKAIEGQKNHPVDIAAKCHYYFIYLHPFPDGNGRLGRLISNFILAKFNHPDIIITKEQKNAYIDVLKATNKHNDSEVMTCFFAETAVRRMKDEILQKSNNSKNTKDKKSNNLNFIF